MSYNVAKDNKGSTLPWIQLYRPKKLSEILSNDHVVNTFKQYVKKQYIPHLLLHGPCGTGKTSIIYATAHELYGEYFDIMTLEINASEERGIEVVRTKIKEFVTMKNLMFNEFKLFKLVILDEADSMTLDAQSMLRRLMEDYTSNARFCLTCNKLKNIDPAIQSRCTVFRFSPLNKKDIEKKVKDIAVKRSINVTPDGVNTIIKIANGDMRKVLNIFQSTYMTYKTVDSKNVLKCLGYPEEKHIKEIYDSIMKDDFSKSVDKVIKIKNDNAYSVLEILNELFNLTIDEYNKKNIKDSYICQLLPKLTDIEMALVTCPNDLIQLSAIVASYKSIKV
uniref:AAA+ ATPase domain-containing protein n=1 Tax=viral metagenome TaxID=1070528 RepID=A0A6C0EG40_9ZZZZ